MSVTAAVAKSLIDAFVLLVAVTVCTPGWGPGAKSPAGVTVPVVALPPLFPSTDQVTPELRGSLVTVAVNCCVCENVRAPRLGLTLTTSGALTRTVIDAADDLVLSVTEVAVRVTVAGFGTVAGAV